MKRLVLAIIVVLAASISFGADVNVEMSVSKVCNGCIRLPIKRGLIETPCIIVSDNNIKRINDSALDSYHVVISKDGLVVFECYWDVMETEIEIPVLANGAYTITMTNDCYEFFGEFSI